MINMRKSIAVILLICVVVILFTSCGKEKSTKEKNSTVSLSSDSSISEDIKSDTSEILSSDNSASQEASQSSTESESEYVTESKPESKLESHTESKPTSKPQPQSPPKPKPEPESEPEPEPQSEQSEPEPQISYEEQVFLLINEERKKEGRAPLKYLGGNVHKAAEKRAEEISQLFDHQCPNGEICFTVLEEYDIQHVVAGENIVAGYNTAEDVMKGWMASKGHRENILSDNYTGVAVAKYGLYWVQIFIG